jgi:hypothetical protein
MLLTELMRLVRDDELLRAAQVAVSHLESGPPAAAEQRRLQLQEREARDRLFEELWNGFIEPEADGSLNRGECGSPALTHRMSYQGVVIDDVIQLFVAGGRWWERARDLVSAVPA